VACVGLLRQGGKNIFLKSTVYEAALLQFSSSYHYVQIFPAVLISVKSSISKSNEYNVETLFSLFRVVVCREDMFGIAPNKQVVQPIFPQVPTWLVDQ
jgi:NADH:ubiquinone oxidoreductase subunit C